MRVNPGDNQSVTLLPLDLIVEQAEDMTLFSVTDQMLVNVDQPRKGIKMTINMKRKILSEISSLMYTQFTLNFLSPQGRDNTSNTGLVQSVVIFETKEYI